jgi:hypothetical protein
MTDTLLWIIFIELTIGLILGGYVLYEIQTALAVIVLHDCTETTDPDVVTPPVLTPEILTEESRPPADETETTGTFTGAAWN